MSRNRKSRIDGRLYAGLKKSKADLQDTTQKRSGPSFTAPPRKETASARASATPKKIDHGSVR